MMELSQATKRLIEKYRIWYRSQKSKENISTIHVDEVASKVAAFYEKIREVVDWKEKHLMRKAAIERILKRRLFLNEKDIAPSLVLELIRGGHFPNDQIEESKIEEVKKSIQKYVYIIENIPKTKESELFQGWLLSIAACEIEEILSPSLKEKALMEYMEEMMKERIVVKKVQMDEKEYSNQVYIAVQRALFKLDTPIITYNLLKRWYPLWLQLNENSQQLAEIAKNIYSIKKRIEKELYHPLGEKFYKICEKYDTPYLILNDIIVRDPEEVGEKIKEPEFLEEKTIEAYKKRLKNLKERITRAAVYATLSIFITKILLAIAIEVPFDKYITGEFNYFVLGLNILIPTLLMCLMVSTIKPPKSENLQEVIMEMMKIVYIQKRKDLYEVRPSTKRGWLMNFIVSLFYILTFIFTFGVIIWGLKQIHFGVISIIIFLIFISLISFAGMKIRERARELEVGRQKENILTMFSDLFSVPILRMGKWLSQQWTRFNIISILINFLIDLPFQSFVEFLEQWRSFLKEKKEEIH